MEPQGGGVWGGGGYIEKYREKTLTFSHQNRVVKQA